MRLLLIIMVSYLIGSFSSAYFIGKVFKNIDIRGHGSGNVGATNALRVMGKTLGILTFLFDIIKGIIAVIIGKSILGFNGGLIGGMFAVVGHNWPVFIGFKGGKGVATSLGALLMLNWIPVVIATILGMIVALVTRYVSLGSISFLTLQPFIYIMIGKSINWNFLIFSVILALLAIIRHRSNIRRLKEGTENKIGRW